MKKHNKIFLIVFIIFIVIILIVFIVNKEDSSNLNIINQKQNITPYIKENEPNLISAYDYIISVMSKPQYWSFNQLYSLPEAKDEANNKLINSTGWSLENIDKASFKRGYEGELTISFSDNTAFNYRSNKYNTYEIKDYYYFNDNKYNFTSEGNYSKEYSYEGKDSSVLWDSYSVIKDIILFYEEIFKNAGCPLLNMPEGTLESYKNKYININENKIDNKILFPWDLDYYQWDYLKEVNWINNSEEIFYKQTPESDLIIGEKIDGTKYYSNYYSPLFLIFTYKDDCSKYLNNKENKLIFDDINYYDCAEGAIGQFLIKPICELCFGYSTVYYIDRDNIKTYNTNIKSGMSKDDFINNISLSKDSSNCIVSVYKRGDKSIGNIYHFDHFGKELILLNNYLKDLCAYYGKEYPFSDDYIFNLYLIYDLTSQRILGLR